ncbi:hypothetical protein GALL_541160 [mine drainage metagenome]|uniref:Uncharacterized protein n=1 Tax=mine drainage metagenome TaxID=410659 RepID=A0A1J5PA23_9ZZZZ
MDLFLGSHPKGCKEFSPMGCGQSKDEPLRLFTREKHLRQPHDLPWWLIFQHFGHVIFDTP